MFVHPIHLYTPYMFSHPRGVHTPYAHIPLCIYMFSEALHVVGGCKRLPLVLGHFPYTPLYGGASLHWHPQTELLASLCIGMFQGYKYVMWTFSLLFEGFGVLTPSVGGVLGVHLHLNVHMLILVYISVVHYVSHFYYGSDYCSSSYSGIFWPVISDSGSFPDRVSSELGSAWSSSTTTLDAKRLWRCLLAWFLCHSNKLHL